MSRIVVGVDGSESSRRALDWAIAEARLRNASLDVVSAWEPPFIADFGYLPPPRPEAAEAVEEQAARELLDEMVSSARSPDLPAEIEKVAARGAPAWALLEVAKDADMVVVGSRGRGGFVGLLLGSVSSQVAAHASCPVVIVPSTR